ncbi:MAG: hypothetical protein ACD_3C00115G0002 [uncultured bacterium (gcode 4)]|uniref:Uncharacterized protein n=1 Tax=uncultured bacterium (gcode 4) TaxID=1234023 RepID=K2G184_9BACT|nr:MAG: hypothetical protein ACD_3C00115G0002 [uncultured bacterium (gcode 4)]
MQSTYSSDLTDAKVSNSFMTKVYNWMFAALLISGWAAYYVSTNPELMNMVILFIWPLIILEFVFVIAMGFLMSKMNSFFTIIMFLLYSLLNWLTLSVITMAYQLWTIQIAFAITAWTFLFMSLYWYFTKSSLNTFWLVLRMGLFWLVLATIVNLFLHSPVTEYVLSWVWVIVFTWLTAYDTQKIKEMWEMWFENWESEMKMSILWALNLYLDFINLFLFMLRLFSWRD